ncbi:K02A2.6-like [Pimephales promelas]|nr:K02A2.6-like [Pimephales promelas]
MSVHVSAPSMFLACPGEPTMPFDMCLRMFENYLTVINAVGDYFRATLLHCLGAEGQRIFYALPDSGETYNSAVDALKKHFMPKMNVVVERHTFRKRVQASHENIQQYVAALHALSVNCDFGDKGDDMIRDQLLEHLHSDDIRQRLLLEPDLTLQKATTLATQLEAAAEHAKRIMADRDAPVQAVQVKSQHASGKPWSRPTAASASSAAIQHPQPWNKAVTEWLQVYRATRHATMGVSPYELIYGRKMRTKLNILPLQGEGKCDLAAVHENVEKKQDKMKLYIDQRRGARNPLFGVGGKVRIRLPRATPKGHPRLSALVRVEERVGTNTFLLSDGKKWNAAHLAYSPEMIDREHVSFKLG